ncbi:MAG: MaoC family dehydratase [Rhodospirillaceae bacterium]|jgi:acyl dehydratase|nr:MaoC family dehydratase [Rhodospirillaceae bacterium]MBT6139062.1 MaoC family dehydratase [Rhodospirillaceae bacterium]
MHPPVYYEDLEPGTILGSQRKTLTESEIVDFAWKYDPQPFHISKPDAEESMFGGLIASGFQTLAVSFRLFWQANGLQTTNAGSGGMDNVRWTKPVRPGDTLRVEAEILERRESKSRPEIGIVRMRYTTYNQHDESVMTFEGPNMVKRRGA